MHDTQDSVPEPGWPHRDPRTQESWEVMMWMIFDVPDDLDPMREEYLLHVTRQIGDRWAKLQKS